MCLLRGTVYAMYHGMKSQLKLSQDDIRAILVAIQEWLLVDEDRLDPETVAIRESMHSLKRRLKKFLPER